jgi:membrane protein DedA with SNARE-associated domain
MHATIEFLGRHGYIVLICAIFTEQLGLPIPAAPTLLAMGALVGLGHFSFWMSLLFAGIASLAGDMAWYVLGRRQGQSILKLLCRISLEPDHCVKRTYGLFGRYGEKGLLLSKFIPGFSMVGAPMAGLMRMKPWRFALFDGTGGLLWAGSFLTVGYLFRLQLERAVEKLSQAGSSFGVLLGVGIAVWGFSQIYQRRRFLHSLRLARVTPQEVMAAMEAGEDVVIVDLRKPEDVVDNPVRLPNAIRIRFEELDERQHEIPRDRDIILYCS